MPRNARAQLSHVPQQFKKARARLPSSSAAIKQKAPSIAKPSTTFPKKHALPFNASFIRFPTFLHLKNKSHAPRHFKPPHHSASKRPHHSRARRTTPRAETERETRKAHRPRARRRRAPARYRARKTTEKFEKHTVPARGGSFRPTRPTRQLSPLTDNCAAAIKGPWTVPAAAAPGLRRFTIGSPFVF